VAAFTSEWVAAFTSEWVAGFVGIRRRKAEKLTEYGMQPFRGRKPANIEEPIEIEQTAPFTTNPTD